MAPDPVNSKVVFEGLANTGAALGDVAQLVEHLLCKQGVTGSNPVISIAIHRVACRRNVTAAARSPYTSARKGIAGQTAQSRTQ